MKSKRKHNYVKHLLLKSEKIKTISFYVFNDNVINKLLAIVSMLVTFELFLRKRANETEELHYVKQELDKAKRQLDKVNKVANHLWKEKEHYLRDRRVTNINELRNQIGAEQAKVSELTKKCQVISKEKEQLLTRLT